MIIFYLLASFLKGSQRHCINTSVEVILLVLMEFFEILSEKLLSYCSMSKILQEILRSYLLLKWNLIFLYRKGTIGFSM